jgi:hypothetical protein
MIFGIFRHHTAHKSPTTGRWCVVNTMDDQTIACECRYEAEVIAADLNRHTIPMPAWFADILAQLARESVNTMSINPPDEES